jgi:hypothetical protein
MRHTPIFFPKILTEISDKFSASFSKDLQPFFVGKRKGLFFLFLFTF